MQNRPVFFAAVCTVLFVSQVTSADQAKFWLSLSDVSGVGPIAPEAPAFNSPQGQMRLLHVSGAPETVGSGPYHPTNNQFRVLQNFSLNVIVDPYVDLLDGTITVHNPSVSGQPRFQFASDSDSPDGCALTSPASCLTTNASATQVAAGTADAIGVFNRSGSDIQGFSLPSTGYVGIGHPNDPLRVESNGVPSWLVASFGLKTAQSSGVSRAYLQIGFNGMVHLGDLGLGMPGSAGTDVAFGFDPGGEPTYNAATERQLAPKSGDDPDVTITATAPLSMLGDYDGDGAIGPLDYAHWRSTFGQTVAAGNGADGNQNGIVDAADYVVWRNIVTPGAGAGVPSNTSQSSLESFAVPEASAVTLVLLASFSISFLCRDLRRRANCRTAA